MLLPLARSARLSLTRTYPRTSCVTQPPSNSSKPASTAVSSLFGSGTNLSRPLRSISTPTSLSRSARSKKPHLPIQSRDGSTHPTSYSPSWRGSDYAAYNSCSIASSPRQPRIIPTRTTRLGIITDSALCPAHNLLMAERVYGVDFLQQKISERRKSRSP